MTPRVLLATTCRWFAAARLAMAFKDVGCVVDVICPDGHPVSLTAAYSRMFQYRGLAPLDSFRAGIIAAQPDIVIPCDDLARTHLHQIYARSLQPDDADTALRSLLERSLGDPTCFSLIDARSRLIALAHELDLRAPETAVISNLSELQSCVGSFGLPVVLKSDGTSGGLGVRIAHSEADAVRAFKMLNAPPLVLRTFKRALVDRDSTLLIPWLQRHRPVVSMQRFLPSKDATVAVACWQGEVLASISVEVLKTWKPKGPASVVRLIDNDEMTLTVRKLAARLKLSGLCGFNFILERDPQRASLIEMNPRATQICHLPLGPSRNLTAALANALTGKAAPESASITDLDVIALFPLEWQNSASSPFLRSAYHDVPWEEPRLVLACVDSRMRDGGWLTYESLNRMLARLPWRRP